jgi:hypothetical protein
MALLVVPGFMADKELWASFETEMEEFGPIINADLSLDDRIPSMARRVIAEAPEPLVLIGFSLGGYVALDEPCCGAAAPLFCQSKDHPLR